MVSAVDEWSSTKDFVFDRERTLRWRFVAWKTIFTSPGEVLDGFPRPLLCIAANVRRCFWQKDSDGSLKCLENINGYDDDTFRNQNYQTDYAVRMEYLLSPEKREEIMDNLLLALPMADDDIPVIKKRFSSFVEEHVSAFTQEGQPMATLLAQISYCTFVPGIVTDIMWDKHRLQMMRAETMRELFEKQQNERNKYFRFHMWVPMPLGDSIQPIRKVAKRLSSSSLPSSSVGYMMKKFVWGRRCKSVCSICLEGYVFKSSQVARLPCRHIFHEDCITQWMETKKTCPVCRHRV